MSEKLSGVAVGSNAVQTATGNAEKIKHTRTDRSGNSAGQAFGSLLQERLSGREQETQGINFSKHALARAQERGIELTPDLMTRLAGSVEKAQEKGATNILALDANQAFIINIPYGRVITTITQEEMKEKVFTNIDSAVLL